MPETRSGETPRTDAGLVDYELIESLRSCLLICDRRVLLLQWSHDVGVEITSLTDTLDDAVKLALMVHKLKGVAASFGASRLAGLLEELELAPTNAAVTELERVYARTILLLRKLLLDE